MKKVLSLFLSCIFVLGVCFSTPIVASATEPLESNEGFFYEVLTYENETPKTCKIVGYSNKEATSISIPQNISVGDSSITQIGVASVLGSAFYDCTNLEYVFLPGTEALWEGEVTLVEGVAVHTSACSYKEYVKDEENATIYESCIGCDEYRGRITLVATENATYGDEVSAIKVEKTGKLADVGNNTEGGYTLSAPTDAGNHTATLTYQGITIEKPFTIAPKTITASLEISGNGVTYNGEEQKPTVKFTDTAETPNEVDLNSEGENADYTVEYANNVNAGTDTATATVTLLNSNYTFVNENNNVATKKLTYSINKATLSASDFTFTKPNELTYDGQQKIAMVTSKKLSDENITLKYYAVVDGVVAETGSTEVPTDVGTYKVKIDVQATDNYEAVSDLADASWEFEITKAEVSITTSPKQNTLTYTGGAQELVTAGTATGGTMQYSLDGVAWSATIPTAKNAGDYTVYYKVVGDANHSDSAEASISVTIGKAPVTISVETQERVYDGTNAVGIKSATVSDVVSGEEISVKFDGVTATSIDAGVGTHTVYFKGDFELVGETAGNYEKGAVSGATVTITAKPLTITAKDATVVINSAMPEFEYTVDGLVDGDSITTVTLTPSADNTATAGEYSVTPSEVKIYAGEADVTANYKITYEAGKLIINDCTAHEWKDGECTNCHTKCEHKDKSNTIDKQPTCVEEGVLLTKCKVCDFVEESTIDVDSDAHKMSDWNETVKATCSSTGTEESVCENGCGHKETRSTEKDSDNHTYGDWVVTAATCVADGVKVKTCTNTECKHELKETIAKDPTAHKMATEWEVTKEPTCVETGLQVKACLNAGCDHEVEEVIAIKADAHNLGGWVVTKAAKCTVAGEITRFCKNGSCEYKVTDSLDADGKTHSFAEEFTTIDATCITAGSKFKACENEGCKEVAEKTEIAINPDAHKNVETINVKKPTCEEKGYTGDEHCNDCKKTFEPGIEVDALGHTESDWIVDKEATFTEDGARHTACTVCSKELKKEVIAKLTLATPVAKAYNKTNSIKVKWTDVDNALTYNVYRSDFINNDWTKWEKIGTVNQGVGEFSDKNVVVGKQYKYTVKAYNGDYKSGIKTSNKLVFITPVKPALKITTTGIILKWDTVLGADKYVAYRSQLVDGKWSDWKSVATIKDGKTSTTDTTVESGAIYKYSVRICQGKSYSERKASASISFLAQPTLKISNKETGIKGSWETINGATGYVITRSEYSDADKKFIATVKLGTAGATTKSFTDKTAKEGVKYKYTVTAINDFGSSIASSGKVLRRLAQPVVTIENANGAIKGKWTQVTGATNYTVYRSELVDGKWTSWKSLGTAGATAKSFTDKTVKSGVNYRYTVKAKNSGSKSSVGASNNVVYLSRPEPKAVNSIYGVKVKWNAITGAESYIVYRKEYVNKQWTEWQQIGTSATNSYIDSTAVSGVKYKYTIHAVSGESLSARKASSSLLHVATPTATVNYTGTALEISWGQIGGATKYVVYRQVLGADGKWSASTKIASLKGVLSFTDTTAEAGNTYRYKVVAYNGKVKSSSNATDGVLLPNAQ